MIKPGTKRGSLKCEEPRDLNMTPNGEMIKRTHQHNGHDCSSQLGNGPSSICIFAVLPDPLFSDVLGLSRLDVRESGC